MDQLDEKWRDLIKAYAGSLATRRDFLKRCGMVGLAYGLAGTVPGLWTGGCGSEIETPRDLPESFTSYETTPTAAHRVLAERHSSVLLLGPPESQDLLALVTHLYTRQSAELAAQFQNKIYATLSELVRVTGKSPDEIRQILRPVVSERHVVLEFDKIFGGMAGYTWVDDLRRIVLDWYGLLRLVAQPVLGIRLPENPEEIFDSTTYFLSPIIPPMFEANFMSGLLSPWHERYATLFGRIFESGYLRSYIRDHGELTLLRTLPVQESLEGQLEIVDADRLSDLLDQVGDVVLLACQCATAKHLRGEPCKMKSKHPGNRPCIIAGPVAKTLIELGWAEPASKEEVLRIRAATADEGAIHITFNVASKDCFYVCACCSCCCQLLQMIRDFQCPNLMAPPPLLPQLSVQNCVFCRACQKVCQTEAHVFSDGLHTLDVSRCVGCGQCLRACSKRNAPEAERPLSWKENRAFRPPLGMNLFLPQIAARLSGILARVRESRGDTSFIK